MKVLVTDGHERACLAIVRSLGRCGHEVHVAARSPSLAGRSRFAAQTVMAPDPMDEPARFLEELLELVRKDRFEVLIPVTEASLGLVLKEAKSFEREGVLVPFGDYRDFEALSNKRGLLKRAREIGIAVPTQRHVTAPNLEGVELQDIPFPVVVKPQRSVVSTGTRQIKATVDYARDLPELERVLQSLEPQAFPVLLQERVHGTGVGVFLLRWHGDTAACFAHRRIREKPPSGGVSVLRESHLLDPDLYEKSVRLVDSYDWNGPAMVEYKVERATGRPYLMEVNARYWGSLQLAVDSGVDFPAIHLDLAAGIAREPITTYSVGVKTRWLLGDVDHLLLHMRRSREELHLPDTTPGRSRVLVDFARAFHPRVHNEVLRWTDPIPALVEFAHWIRQLRA